MKKLNSIIINKITKLTSTRTFKTEDFKLKIDVACEIDLSLEAKDIDLKIEGSAAINLKEIAEELNS